GLRRRPTGAQRHRAAQGHMKDPRALCDLGRTKSLWRSSLMTRRHLLTLLSAVGLAPRAVDAQTPPAAPRIEPLTLSDAQWKQRLTPAQYEVLRHEGTERAFTSPLNDE